MTLLQLEILKTVVETGSFTKAGEIMGLTQSAISHAMTGLESEFGMSLVTRSRTGVVPTAAGEQLLCNIHEVISQTEQIKQKVSQILGLISGTVRIGCYSSVAAKLLPGILKQFTASYPAIKAQLFEGSYQEISKWAVSGIVDIGFVILPNKELDITPLIRDEYVVVLPENHRLKNALCIELPEIADEPFVMPLGGCEMFVNRIFKEIDIKPKVLFEVEHSNIILAMVKGGLGISIIPELFFEFPGVVTVGLKPKLYREIGLGVRCGQAAAPATKAFIATAQSWLMANGYDYPGK